MNTLRTRLALLGLALLVIPYVAPAWSGDAWGPITRAAIKANADLMIDSTWTPKNTFTNWQYGTSYQVYSKGVTYTGVPYSQSNPQDTWSEFYNYATNTSGGSVQYGNDCSGFASICWKLPSREVTSWFESQIGTYWTSLGATGTAVSASLLVGDALNSATVGHIVLFLNYETTGVRTMEQTPDNAQRKVRTYSNLAEYRPIRRLQLSDAPSLSVDGLSRVADAGSAVSYSVTAAGTTPFTYRWRFNGNTIAGATTSKLTFIAAQLTNAGSYVCVVTNAYGSVTSRVMSLTVYPVQTTVFLDTFDTNTATQWLLSKSSTDTRATFSYDYSGLGIPSAPRSTGGTTRGLRLEANMTAGAVAAISLSPVNRSFAGDYRLRFDLWMNANGPFPAGGTGSSQHSTAGLGTAGNRVEWTGAGTTADGYWFAVDGEGQADDTSATIGDFCAFAGTSIKSSTSGVYAAGTNTTAKGNIDPYYVDAFPGAIQAPALQRTNYTQQTGALAAGTIGFAWHEVIVARRGNTVDWAIDGIRLATITNASFTASNVFVGYWDSYASLSDNTNLSFGLVDNVRVEVPVIAPAVVSQPRGQTNLAGASVTLSVAATGTEPLCYRWQCGGTNCPPGTNAMVVAAAGNYAVTVSNVAGMVTSAVAMVAFTNAPPAEPGHFDAICRLPDGSMRMGMAGTPGTNYVVQWTSDWLAWSNLCTLSGTNGTFWLVEPCATNSGRRFYRLRLGP